jgi:hypothetical protein
MAPNLPVLRKMTRSQVIRRADSTTISAELYMIAQIHREKIHLQAKNRPFRLPS